MCFSARYLPTVLLTILSLSASLCAQSTTKQPGKVPRGSVSGRVTIKENGAAGVVIGLRKGELYTSGEPYLKATTDQDGFYRFGNLTPGNYSLVLAAPAFVMTRKDSQSKNVVVSEDESVEGINFALVRGGVITGRVTDGEGRPLIAQQVKVYTVEVFERRLKDQPVYPEREVQTDDRGIYRVFGLSAGRVQSVALRLIVEREREIMAFKPEEYWTVTAFLGKDKLDEAGKEALAKFIKAYHVTEPVVEKEEKEDEPQEEEEAAEVAVHDGQVVDRGRHLARHEALPDELVELELVGLEEALHLLRPAAHQDDRGEAHHRHVVLVGDGGLGPDAADFGF